MTKLCDKCKKVEKDVRLKLTTQGRWKLHLCVPCAIQLFDGVLMDLRAIQEDKARFALKKPLLEGL